MPLRKPSEDCHRRIELEIQLVRVDAAIRRPLGWAELVDDIEMRFDPFARVLARQPHEGELSFDLDRIAANVSAEILSRAACEGILVGAPEWRNDGLERETQARQTGWNVEGEDRLEHCLAPGPLGVAAARRHPGRPEQGLHRDGWLDVETRRAKKPARPGFLGVSDGCPTQGEESRTHSKDDESLGHEELHLTGL